MTAPGPVPAVPSAPDREAAATAGPYSIGSDLWPGLSKLIEECGEVLQVAGKIVAIGGGSAHWDGTDLRRRMTEELADLSAAVAFVAQRCGLASDEWEARLNDKYALFERWHTEQGVSS